MTTTVTASPPDSYEAGGIRNTPQNSRSGTVTASPPDSYASGQVSVTCKRCGGAVEYGAVLLIFDRSGWARGLRCGDPVCGDCTSADLGLWPWNRGARRPQRYYRHACERCARPFYGGSTRRYCSDACGQADRAARRMRPLATHHERDCTCGKPFIPLRSDAAYCSPACRQKAYRQRQAS